VAEDFILSDEVAPGDLLPSEKELSALYGVSRVTMRAGLRSLHEAGMIAVRHGVGSVVLPRSRALTHGLDSLASLEGYATLAGQQIGTTDVEWDEHPADEALARRLQLQPGHTMLQVRRVKTLDGVRVGWITDWLPAGLVDFGAVREEFQGSVLDVLLTRDELAVAYEDTQITAVSLDADIAKRLDAEPGTAVMHMAGTTFSVQGSPLEYAEAWLLPEHFSFSVRRRRQLTAAG
jgi:DNA-binding GntR family transcriptional regulator